MNIAIYQTVNAHAPAIHWWLAQDKRFGPQLYQGMAPICNGEQIGSIVQEIRNEDIDADNADALFWAMSYRTNPIKDIKTVDYRGQGHGPKREHGGEEDSTLLIDATMKSPMPPLALPGKEHMARAKEIWDEMGLPKLNVQMPWHGYSLGAWHKIWDDAGHRAANGDYLENGRISKSLSVKGLKPETKLDPDSGKPFKS